METRVGALIPEVYRNDALDFGPQNELEHAAWSIRTIHTFYVMRGGDSLADLELGRRDRRLAPPGSRELYR